MKNRIVLLVPPYPIDDFPSPPLGLLHLGTYLKQNGYEVMIDDYVVNLFSHGRVKSIVKKFQPDFIGAAGATMNINRSMDILKHYKEAKKSIVTIAGGPHVSFDAENMLSVNPHLDFVVRGEGEITTFELLESFKNGKSLHSISGLSYKKDGGIIHNPSRDFIRNINILPAPSLKLVEMSKYIALGLPVNMITSRGCPNKCIFCVGSRMGGNIVRYYDVQRVVDEFEKLSNIGACQINIADDLFTSNKKRCTDICREIIDRGIKHPWTAFARVDTVSPELLEIMRKAGCTTLCFGIESGNQDILDKIKKRTDLKKCRSAVKMCRDAGIEPMTAYILGLPGETQDTIEETMNFSRELSPNHGYHILAPFPGTEVREKCDNYEIRILTDNWDDYDARHAVSEPFRADAEEIEAIACNFRDGIENFVNSIIKRHENHEILSESDQRIVDSRKKISFLTEVILKRLIEKFKMKDDDKKLDSESLAEYTSHMTGYKSEYTIPIIDSIIADKLIVRTIIDGWVKYYWSGSLEEKL